jgi:4-hydroxy-L-threonine phosphate dehydrogenase PdxA
MTTNLDFLLQRLPHDLGLTAPTVVIAGLNLHDGTAFDIAGAGHC